MEQGKDFQHMSFGGQPHPNLSIILPVALNLFLVPIYSLVGGLPIASHVQDSDLVHVQADCLLPCCSEITGKEYGEREIIL